MTGSVDARWDADLYAARSSHHRAFDSEVLRGLPVVPGGLLLDLGCGTGELTRRLPHHVPGGQVIGVDVDPGMVRAAAAAADSGDPADVADPAPRFCCRDARDLDGVAAPASVDIAVSTAMLHWVPQADQPRVLAGVARLLRPGGVLHVDMGGRGQIAAIRALLDEVSSRLGGPVSPWFFPDPPTYEPLLRDAGLRVDDIRLLRQRRSFSTVTHLLGLLHSQVLLGYLPGLGDAADAFVEEVDGRAILELRRSDGSYDQDYVRLQVRASR